MLTLVDLVIPTYKEEKYIVGTLKNVQEQTAFNDDKYLNIIVADYSPDKKNDVMKKICKDFNVQFVDVTKKGIGYARHVGSLVGKAPVIMSFDADAKFMDKDTVYRLVRPIVSEEKILTCCKNVLDSNDIVDKSTLTLGQTIYDLRNIASYIGAGYEPGLTVSRKAYMKVGGYRDVHLGEGIILDATIALYYGLLSRQYFNDVSIRVSSRRVNQIKTGDLGVFLDYDSAFREDQKLSVNNLNTESNPRPRLRLPFLPFELEKR